MITINFITTKLKMRIKKVGWSVYFCRVIVLLIIYFYSIKEPAVCTKLVDIVKAVDSVSPSFSREIVSNHLSVGGNF